LLCPDTIFFTTEISCFTFETLIISKLKHSKFL
jgi:hypothetical protein